MYTRIHGNNRSHYECYLLSVLSGLSLTTSCSCKTTVTKIKNQWLRKLKLVLHYIMQNNELDLGLLAKFPEITLHSQILMLPASITCSMEAMKVEFGVRVWERGSSSSCMHLPLTHGVLSYTMSSFHSHFEGGILKSFLPKNCIDFQKSPNATSNTQLTPIIFSLSYHFIHGLLWIIFQVLFLYQDPPPPSTKSKSVRCHFHVFLLNC